MDRRGFLGQLSLAVGAVGAAPLVRRIAAQAPGSEFTFARLRYDSGDWDYNPKVCSNVLDAVVQYT